jgi:hypothetical protein
MTMDNADNLLFEQHHIRRREAGFFAPARVSGSRAGTPDSNGIILMADYLQTLKYLNFEFSLQLSSTGSLTVPEQTSRDSAATLPTTRHGNS